MDCMPDCIIPAAGLSARMGAWKPGMPWGSATVIESVLAASTAAGCRTIIAGGNRYEDLRTLLEGVEGIILAEITGWESGMDATVRGALGYVETDEVFIVPADMPMVRSEDFRKLKKEGNGVYSRPVYDGVPGHPVLLGPKAVEIVKRSPAGRPLHRVLAGVPFFALDWNHPGVIRDLDTIGDYKALRQDDIRSD